MNTTQELGRLSQNADGYLVQFDRVYEHPIEKVWDAITNPEILRIWFTDIEMDFRPGGKMTIWFRDEVRTATAGEILEIDPPHRFVFSWEGEIAEWELAAIGSRACRMRFTYSKIKESYAARVPAGFHILFDQLETVLDGRTHPYPFGTDYNDPSMEPIKDLYKEMIVTKFPQLEKYDPVVVERTYNVPASRVWKAITDKNQMKQWYFDLEAFVPVVGFEFKFKGQGQQGEKYMHLCKITEVVPEQKLQYTWQYENLEGQSSVSFELFDEGNSTRLRVTHTGLETFAHINSDFSRENFMQGWTELIGKMLKDVVESPK